MLDAGGRNVSSGDPPSRPGALTSFPALEVATQVLAGFALLLALYVGLLPSLLAGLLIYELVQVLAPQRTLLTRRTSKIIAVSLLSALITLVIGAGIFGLVSLLSGGSESLEILLRQMAEEHRHHCQTEQHIQHAAEGDRCGSEGDATMNGHQIRRLNSRCAWRPPSGRS